MHASGEGSSGFWMGAIPPAVDPHTVAIKAYRDATAVGLREAKEAVEQMARDRGLEIG
jgi:hypothetical protein